MWVPSPIPHSPRSYTWLSPAQRQLQLLPWSLLKQHDLHLWRGVGLDAHGLLQALSHGDHAAAHVDRKLLGVDVTDFLSVRCTRESVEHCPGEGAIAPLSPLVGVLPAARGGIKQDTERPVADLVGKSVHVDAARHCGCAVDAGARVAGIEHDDARPP